VFNRVYTTGEPCVSFDWEIVRKDGEKRFHESSVSLIRDSKGERIGFRGIVRDITERKRAEEEILRRNQELAALNEIGRVLSQLAAPAEIMELIYTMVGRVLDNSNFYIALYDEANQYISFPVYTIDGQRITGRDRPWGNALTEYVIRTKAPLLIPRSVEAAAAELGIQHSGRPARCYLAVPMLVGEKVIGVMAIQDYCWENVYDRGHVELLSTFAAQATIALENARLYRGATLHAQRHEALYRISTALSRLRARQELCETVVREVHETLGVPYLGLFLRDSETGDRVLQAQCGFDNAPEHWRLHPGEGLSEKALLTGELQYWPDVTREPRYVPGRLGMLSEVDIPLKIAGSVLGVLVVEDGRVDAFGAEDFAVLQAVGNQLSVALENARLFEETSQHLKQVQALHAIDMAISGSLDLRVTLNVLLDQITTQLGVDAADVLLLNPHSQALEYAAGRGFRTAALQHTYLRLGEGHAGRAALERHIVNVPDMAGAEDGFKRSPLLHQEGFIAYYGVPLIAKGQVKGVLELFHRAPLAADPEWLEFLETLATQTAIAIDNASLFDNLQRANVELTMAYDTTLEGWSRALDLRDKETEGHTQRVTELTLRLARAMGVSEDELVHVRRGVLLHDIGKMGIPDSILLKPGPFTEEEWAIMRQHPLYAYKMLAPIVYLHSALDIPYCHHEKWDGTGYPRGLKGEEIPLAARIFAVVDVWDALRSDRPYRPAWPEEKAWEYIQEQAGKHFDPRVVEVFLRTR
jgi:HD-GYP domain-containing protein (c-di-GMP phosphodiesterase class II)